MNHVQLTNAQIEVILASLDLPNAGASEMAESLRDVFRKFYPVDAGQTHELYR